MAASIFESAPSCAKIACCSRGVAVERLISPVTRRKTSQHGASIRCPLAKRFPRRVLGVYPCGYPGGKLHDDDIADAEKLAGRDAYPETPLHNLDRLAQASGAVGLRYVTPIDYVGKRPVGREALNPTLDVHLARLYAVRMICSLSAGKFFYSVCRNFDKRLVAMQVRCHRATIVFESPVGFVLARCLMVRAGLVMSAGHFCVRSAKHWSARISPPSKYRTVALCVALCVQHLGFDIKLPCLEVTHRQPSTAHRSFYAQN